MFRPYFLGHHQVLYLIEGNYTICDIRSLVFKEISFSSVKSLSFKILNQVNLITYKVNQSRYRNGVAQRVSGS